MVGTIDPETIARAARLLAAIPKARSVARRRRRPLPSSDELLAPEGDPQGDADQDGAEQEGVEQDGAEQEGVEQDGAEQEDVDQEGAD